MLPILFNNNAPRTDNLLIICPWCNKIKTGNGKWQEDEEAVESLSLFELKTLPMISHGMCDSLSNGIVEVRRVEDPVKSDPLYICLYQLQS